MGTEKKLFFRRLGEKGPKLILLHGLMGSSDNWQKIARALSANYDVFVPDLRNHGRSFHAHSHTLQAMRDDILQLMDEEKISVANLLGHSMGGKVAMSFAIEYPDRVRKLVVVDIAMRRYPKWDNQRLLTSLAEVSLFGLRSRKELDKAFEKVVPEALLRQFLLKNLVRDKKNNFLWRPNLNLLCLELPKYLGEVQVKSPSLLPTLLIRGISSSYLRDSDVEYMKSAFSCLSIEELQTGHWPHTEQPEAFVAILETFLK